MEVTLKYIAESICGTVKGDDQVLIKGINSLVLAEKGEISFFSDPRLKDQVKITKASAIIVTEPTPSGYYDMKKALDVVNHFKIKKGIIINKYDLNQQYEQKIEAFAKDNNIKIIQKIKFDKNIIKAMAKMMPIVDYDKNYIEIFDNIKTKILKEINL